MNENKKYSNDTDLLHRISRTIRALQMIREGDRVLIGVSGGPDSVLLLYLLHRLSLELSFRIGVAHFNHCLRGKMSDDDAGFVQSLSRDLNLSYYTDQKDTMGYKKKHGLSLEDAARRLRYEFYHAVAKADGFNKIALGHHKDDNAEVVLMHLFRGSGPKGISGIPAVRSHPEDDITIVRPLMDLTKSEIMDFLNRMKIPYVMDKTNRDKAYLRNKVRHELLPVLKSTFNPNITESLHRLASILSTEEDWIETILDPVYEKTLIQPAGGPLRISLTEFVKLHTAVQRRVIRRAVGKIQGHAKRFTLSHIDAVIRFATSGPNGGSIDLPGCIRVSRDSDTLLITRENASLRDLPPGRRKKSSPRYHYIIKDPSKGLEGHNGNGAAGRHLEQVFGFVYINEINASLRCARIPRQDLPDMKKMSPKTAFLDMDKLSFPLILRNSQPGDRFTPMGMSGTQKFKKYFVDHKIPQSRREKTPVLVSGEKIIWLVGHRIDEAYKVTPATRNVLKAELFLA